MPSITLPDGTVVKRCRPFEAAVALSPVDREKRRSTCEKLASDLDATAGALARLPFEVEFENNPATGMQTFTLKGTSITLTARVSNDGLVQMWPPDDSSGEWRYYTVAEAMKALLEHEIKARVDKARFLRQQAEAVDEDISRWRVANWCATQKVLDMVLPTVEAYAAVWGFEVRVIRP